MVWNIVPSGDITSSREDWLSYRVDLRLSWDEAGTLIDKLTFSKKAALREARRVPMKNG